MNACASKLYGRIRSLTICLALPVTLLLSGCGSGTGGVGIADADGQSPDPVLVEVPIAYVKRPLPLNDQGGLEPGVARELQGFEVGADLYMRDRASITAAERNITGGETLGMGDVRDVEVSYDGERVIFAMRGPFDPGLDDEDQPPWNIWEYDRVNDVLRRVITSNITANAAHDVAPHYLPDGRIIFSSNRQRQSGAILLDEGKPQFSALDEARDEYAFVLHVMNDDGTDIQQVSFNQSHDLDPAVTNDGKVVFSRWDRAPGNDNIHLYRMNPDGTGLELLYGLNSHDTGTGGAEIEFLQARQLPDGSLLVSIRQAVAGQRGGDLIRIDADTYVDNTQATAPNAGMPGPAQSSTVINDVRTDGSISPGGHFSDAFPLDDGTSRMFVSWSQCRLIENGQVVPCTPARLADPAAVPAAPAYGIWIYDLATDTQLPVVPPETGMLFTDIVAAGVRTQPPIILDIEDAGTADTTLLTEGTGILNVRSVYDVDGVDTAVPDIPGVADPVTTPPDTRVARFIRLVKAVGIPDDDLVDLDATDFGRSALNGMREIIGYVPIAPDGSVQVKVPANVPLQFNILDAQGRRIGPRHNNWLQVRPGEVRNCTGCHDGNSGLAHGRDDAFDSAYPGASTTSQPFPNSNPAYFADFGETMAEAQGRISCATDCAAITPSVNVTYVDDWTDPVAATPGTPFSYDYAAMATTAPASLACQTAWAPTCRSVINYVEHIQPLWDEPRLAPDGITDVTCTGCHRRVDDMGAPMVPEGQLDLTPIPDPVVTDHLISYRELLFNDNEEFFDPVAMIVRDRLVVVGFDPDTGDPIEAPIVLTPSITIAGARASGDFFDRFDAGGTHEGWLTPDELRLVSEWVDIGAQYFNNPFDVPIN